jgi:hypothetical protein
VLPRGRCRLMFCKAAEKLTEKVPQLIEDKYSSERNAYRHEPARARRDSLTPLLGRVPALGTK